jgi:hypothetical protein
MSDKQRILEKAIDSALRLARVEILRLYADEDIGTIVINVGKAQMRVKSTPERISEPISLETKDA